MVAHHHRRAVQYEPGQCDLGDLRDVQAFAALADHGVQPVGECFDPVLGAHGAQGVRQRGVGGLR